MSASPAAPSPSSSTPPVNPSLTPPPFKVLRRPVESAQYLSIRYTDRLAELGIIGSVGSRGDSFDNALAETVNGLFKTELIKRRGGWRSVEQVELATLEWVEWWNRRRLHTALGARSPAEFEAAYHQDQQQPVLAGATENGPH